jgi:hypothetical protein
MMVPLCEWSMTQNMRFNLYRLNLYRLDVQCQIVCALYNGTIKDELNLFMNCAHARVGRR